MVVSAFELIIAAIVSLVALVMLLISDWRTNIGLMAAQFLGVFFFTSLEWPVSIAVSVLITGWVAGAVLAMAVFACKNDVGQYPSKIEQGEVNNPIFTFLASLIVVLLVFSLASRTGQWIPALDISQAWTAILLIGLGLLRLAINPDPALTTIGLLTLFSGFEILFSGLSASRLAVALLAMITLLIALAGSYMILAPTMDNQE